jgi:hypothetical protein
MSKHLEFKKLDEYIEQNERRMQKLQQVEEERKKAEADLLELKTRYELVARQAVINDDKSKDAELLKIDKQIQEAEAKVRLAEQKRAVIHSIPNRGVDEVVTKDDLFRAFNSEFAEKYKKDVMKAIYQRMLDVKEQAEEVAEEYRQAVATFNDKRGDVLDVLGDSYYYKLAKVDVGHNRDNIEKYFITEKFARELRYN